MKKQLSIIVGCLLLMAGLAFGQATASFSLVNGGSTTSATYNPSDAFTLNLSGTFSGFTGAGYSLWLETQTGLAPAMNITGETFSTWTSPNDDPSQYTNASDVFPKAFTDTSGRTNSGFLTDVNTIPDSFSTLHTGDLGATGGAKTAGTYSLAALTFQLTNATPGTYILESTTASPKGSEISDSSFAGHFAPSAMYTITIVPEPATWSLLGLGGLGSLGLTWLRARRKG